MIEYDMINEMWHVVVDGKERWFESYDVAARWLESERRKNVLERK